MSKSFHAWFGTIALLTMYSVSLCLPALYERGAGGWMGGGTKTYWGIECLGLLPFVMVVPPWWANPLFFAGVACYAWRRNLAAIVLGILSTLFALGTLIMVWDSFFARPGRDAYMPIGAGYFVWVASMVCLVVLSFLGWRTEKKGAGG